MSAASAKTTDPTMEEILASIRRIIADDDEKAPDIDADPGAAEAGPSAAVHDAPDEEERDEVLDLADFHESRGTGAGHGIDLPDLSFAPAPQPVPERAPEPVPSGVVAAPEPERPAPPRLAAMVQPAADPVIRAVEEAPPPPAGRAPAGQAAPPPYEPARRPAAPPPAPPPPSDAIISQEATASVGQAFSLLSHTIMSQNATTLEDIVREMLKPMLKSWLDDNLPPLVERLVAAEIQRVARGQR